MTTTRRTAGLCAAMLLLWLGGRAAGENWPQWRGPLFNGSTTETDLPTEFSPTSEDLAWSAEMPGIGGSTPIIWEDHVFVTAQAEPSKGLWAACLDRDSGRVRWKHAMGEGFTNRYGNTGASPSPITDGETVWFHFGTGEMAAFDLAGKELWRRNLAKDHGPFQILWDYGSTALLLGGRLYVPVIQGDYRKGPTDTGFLLCVEPASGKDLWKAPRPSEATGEAKQAYTTPIPYRPPGGAQTWVLLGGGDWITAHEASAGRLVWRSPSYNPRRDKTWRTIVSPAVADGMVIAAAPRGGHHLYGAALGSEKPDWAWDLRAGSPDVCTPLTYGGRFFVVDGARKELRCLEPKTGRTIWQGDLGGKAVFQASPTGADGKIYCLSKKGEAVVVSAGDRFEVLHRVSLGGDVCQSSIAVAGGQLFVRTDTKLYCFGKRRR